MWAEDITLTSVCLQPGNVGIGRRNAKGQIHQERQQQGPDNHQNYGGRRAGSGLWVHVSYSRSNSAAQLLSNAIISVLSAPFTEFQLRGRGRQEDFQEAIIQSLKAIIFLNFFINCRWHYVLYTCIVL